MSTFSGSGSLIWFILRRERVRLSIWVVVLAVIPIATANAFIGLYPTEQSRQALVATVGSSPALSALLGPLHDSSIGALTAWRAGPLGILAVALLAILTMIRHTREEEETGRRELLGSTVVGRQAQLIAAFVVTVGAGLVMGAILSGGLIGIGLPVPGSVAYGAAYATAAIAFAGLGALAAQLTENASTARGLGVAAVGVAFLLRMGGDTGGEGLEWLGWLSPLGWFSRLRPFAGENWWMLGLWAGFGLAAATVSVAIATRRDVGAGAFAPRPGPAGGAAGLSSPLALAWRLQRGSILGWTAGLAVLGAVYGGSAESVADMLEGNPLLAEIFEQMGGEQGLADTFFSAAIGVIALITAAYSIRTVLRLSVEEDAERAEPVLSTATPRVRWAWSHLVFGVLGPVLVLVAAAVFAGAAYEAIVGDVSGQVPRVVGAALVNLPAVWVLTGTAMALYGLLPRHVELSWGVLVFFFILGQLGQILQFPQWSLNLSPFTHVPMFPAEDVQALPLVILLAISAALMAVGLTGFRHRDLR